MTATTRPRLIFGKLFLLGIVAVGMIITSVIWLTARIDQVEQENDINIVQLMVTERVSHMQNSASDYANWNLAYEIVMENDVDSILENIGSGAVDGGLFDNIVLIDVEGNILHVFDAAEETTTPEQFDRTGIEPFLSQLRTTKPGDKIAVSGIGRINGQYGAVGAAWITPDYYSNLNGAPLPIIVGIRMMTDDALEAIAQLTLGTEYAITPINADSTEAHLDLVGPQGTPVAKLVWQPHRPGAALREEILPGILLVCFGIFAICISAARYFHQQSKALDQAMTIASTDQLTGLLNRSGLHELLRSTDLRARIDHGHLAIIYVDVNHFKKLNDDYGHKVGDHALSVTADRLREAVRKGDHVVRLGGDEFICIIRDHAPETAAKSVSDHILTSCMTPVSFAELEFNISLSLGIAVAERGLTWETLLARADGAMYQAKRKKQKSAEIYTIDSGVSGDPNLPRSLKRSLAGRH
ncbi:diguanylate cyclase domain-containing protein [Roseibium sediminis]|uniref:diguanylate cyclase domain-containing protein n=1 Tax=Roseibium sediminis TaxID=1775174 RepID=UPI00123CA984|nr:diguanylate cyclase [Roseibium sediminis]